MYNNYEKGNVIENRISESSFWRVKKPFDCFDTGTVIKLRFIDYDVSILEPVVDSCTLEIEPYSDISEFPDHCKHREIVNISVSVTDDNGSWFDDYFEPAKDVNKLYLRYLYIMREARVARCKTIVLAIILFISTFVLLTEKAAKVFPHNYMLPICAILIAVLGISSIIGAMMRKDKIDSVMRQVYYALNLS